MYPDIDEARALHAQLRDIVARHAGTAADYRALRRVLDLCRCAAATLDDRYCRDKLRLVEEFAAEMFAHSDHARWDREAVPGGEFLRRQIADALELFESRLFSLESRRRTGKAFEALRA